MALLEVGSNQKTCGGTQLYQVRVQDLRNCVQAIRNQHLRAMTRRLVDETDRVLIAKPPGTFKVFVPFIFGSLGAREKEQKTKFALSGPLFIPR